jgi:predicted N-formylglutamate amidohydrolase
LADDLDGALVVSRVTRLLVDLNRSPGNPRVFSEVTRSLPRTRRLALIERYHRPHIEAVRTNVADPVASGHRVLHVGVHSFVPLLNGARRRQDLALLYDPARVRERDLAAAWIAALARARPDLRLRRNHPYRGRNDGLTTALRRSFGETEYVGIEVEVSQRHVRGDGRFPPWIPRLLAQTLRDVWVAPRRPVASEGERDRQ